MASGSRRPRKEAGGDARVFIADVSKEQDVARLEREVIAAFGGVQILINNAGINVRKPITDFTLDEWNNVMATNLTSAFLLCRAFIPHMKGGGYGRIINIASTMSHVSIAHRGAYSASKAGLLGFTRPSRSSSRPKGSRSTASAPDRSPPSSILR